MAHTPTHEAYIESLQSPPSAADGATPGLEGEADSGGKGGADGGGDEADGGGGDGEADGGGDGEADGGGGGDGEADGGGQSDEPSQNHVGSGVPSQVVPTYLQYRNPGLGGFAYQLLRTLLSHSSLLAE